jgi:chaperonin cofactor prefoldin
MIDPNILEYMSNIQYTLGEVVTQAGKVKELVSAEVMDLETVKLNLEDLDAQMNVAKSELKDLSGIITQELQG